MDNTSTNKLVVNLSRLKLSNGSLSLLSKGLNFCPTPNEPNPGQSKDDLDNLHRILSLAHHSRPDLEDRNQTLLNFLYNLTSSPLILCHTDNFSAGPPLIQWGLQLWNH